MNTETRQVKVNLPLDLIELLEREAVQYPSFTKMMQAVCRRYFLHQSLREEFAKLEK
jgi:hypothetical protein